MSYNWGTFIGIVIEFIAFWPQQIPRRVTLECFIAAFETLRYAHCDSEEYEDGFEPSVSDRLPHTNLELVHEQSRQESINRYFHAGCSMVLLYRNGLPMEPIAQIKSVVLYACAITL